MGTGITKLTTENSMNLTDALRSYKPIRRKVWYTHLYLPKLDDEDRDRNVHIFSTERYCSTSMSLTFGDLLAEDWETIDDLSTYKKENS